MSCACGMPVRRGGGGGGERAFHLLIFFSHRSQPEAVTDNLTSMNRRKRFQSRPLSMNCE